MLKIPLGGEQVLDNKNKLSKLNFNFIRRLVQNEKKEFINNNYIDTLYGDRN